MYVKELKKILAELGDEYDDYNICNGEIGMLDDQHQYRVDKPIAAVYVDKDTKEIIFLHENINEDLEEDTDPILNMLHSQEFMEEFGARLDQKAKETGGPVSCFVEDGWLHAKYHDETTEPLKALN